jgi:hypothetical protein
MKIDLRIERLVLDGLPVKRRQGAQLQAAIEGELVRLLTADSALAGLQASGAVASLSGVDIHVGPGSDLQGMAKQIAASLHAGLGGGR